jgi:hypothetical protein
MISLLSRRQTTFALAQHACLRGLHRKICQHKLLDEQHIHGKEHFYAGIACAVCVSDTHTYTEKRVQKTSWWKICARKDIDEKESMRKLLITEQHGYDMNAQATVLEHAGNRQTEHGTALCNTCWTIHACMLPYANDSMNTNHLNIIAQG